MPLSITAVGDTSIERRVPLSLPYPDGLTNTKTPKIVCVNPQGNSKYIDDLQIATGIYCKDIPILSQKSNATVILIM